MKYEFLNQSLRNTWPFMNIELPPLKFLECYHYNEKQFKEWGGVELANHIKQSSICQDYLREIETSLASRGPSNYFEYIPGKSDEEIFRSIDQLLEREKMEPQDDLTPGDLVATAAKIKTYNTKTGEINYHWNFSPMLAILTKGPKKPWGNDGLQFFRCFAVSILNTQWANKWQSTKDFSFQVDSVSYVAHFWLDYPIAETQIRFRIGSVQNEVMNLLFDAFLKCENPPALLSDPKLKNRVGRELAVLDEETHGSIHEEREMLHERAKWLGATALTRQRYALNQAKKAKNMKVEEDARLEFAERIFDHSIHYDLILGRDSKGISIRKEPSLAQGTFAEKKGIEQRWYRIDSEEHKECEIKFIRKDGKDLCEIWKEDEPSSILDKGVFHISKTNKDQLLIKNFLDELQLKKKRKWKDSTRERRASEIKHFLKWAFDNEHILHECAPAHYFTKPSYESRKPLLDQFLAFLSKELTAIPMNDAPIWGNATEWPSAQGYPCEIEINGKRFALIPAK
jgi:hypothetical protein